MAPRDLALREYQGQLDQSLEELDDLAWLERLHVNADFGRLLKLYHSHGIVNSEKILQEQTELLYSKAMSSNENAKALEVQKILASRIEGSKDFMSFVEREVKRLQEVRDLHVPALKEKIEELSRPVSQL